MKKSIRKFSAFILIFTLTGCSVSEKTISGTFGTLSENKDIILDNFKAEKSRGALFVKGELVNLTGSDVSKIEIEAKGYDKAKNLISTDKIELAQSRFKNKEKISFMATFVKNVDKIDAYYFFGQYELIKSEIKINWKALGVVLLAAGAVLAISASAYYSGYDGYSFSGNINNPVYAINQPHYDYSVFQSAYTQPKEVVQAGGVLGEFNPNNPLSEYSSLTGKFNPNNPLSEYTSPLGSFNPNNPLSEISSPLGKYNPNNPLSEISSPTGSLNPNNPLSEVSSLTGKFNPNNPLGEGIHPYYYWEKYLKK